MGVHLKPELLQKRLYDRIMKRVDELEAGQFKRLNAWTVEWPGGINIDTVSVKPEEYHIANTARKLGHAVVVIPRLNGNDYQFMMYARELHNPNSI